MFGACDTFYRSPPARTIGIVETSSFDRLYLRQPAFEADSVRAMLKKAHQEAIALKETETLLAERFDLSIGLGLYTPAQLLEHADIISEASLWRRLVGHEYRTAVQTYRRIAPGRQKVSRVCTPPLNACARNLAGMKANDTRIADSRSIPNR
jgi:hypothetical protein